MLSSIDNDMMQQQQQKQKTQQMQQYKKNHIQTRSTAKTVAKRILLVSSEDDVNLALKLALEKEQDDDDKSCFKVDSFNNPILALKNFKNGFYDLVIIDIVMPQMNGFELSEKIRKVDDKVKICFLTAGEIPSKVRFDPFSQGYQDRFIRLPIENEVLIEHIDRIIIHS
jgi:two-component system alkaline phosphatase synthesis response regulator PhoP